MDVNNFKSTDNWAMANFEHLLPWVLIQLIINLYNLIFNNGSV
jgi:hypothetical protein